MEEQQSGRPNTDRYTVLSTPNQSRAMRDLGFWGEPTVPEIAPLTPATHNGGDPVGTTGYDTNREREQLIRERDQERERLRLEQERLRSAEVQLRYLTRELATEQAIKQVIIGARRVRVAQGG
jgi:hypothetical protein